MRLNGSGRKNRAAEGKILRPDKWRFVF